MPLQKIKRNLEKAPKPEEKKLEDPFEELDKPAVETPVEQEVQPDPASREKRGEAVSEKESTVTTEQHEPASTKVPAGKPAVVAPVEPVSKSEEQAMIETILSEGLEDLYKQLPPNRQQEFKIKGEETASQIEKLLGSAKVQMNKIIDLIKGWLSMIPGVNKYFLAQESKIKADRLIEYKNEKEGEK